MKSKIKPSKNADTTIFCVVDAARILYDVRSAEAANYLISVYEAWRFQRERPPLPDSIRQFYKATKVSQTDLPTHPAR